MAAKVKQATIPLGHYLDLLQINYLDSADLYFYLGLENTFARCLISGIIHLKTDHVPATCYYY